MGSSLEEIEKCIAQWSSKLQHKSYDAEILRTWVLKEYPKHLVQIAPFSIGKFPITNDQYLAFAQETNILLPESIRSHEPADHPVWGVSFEDASTFCRWVGTTKNLDCRVPTEAEWEFAARGNNNFEYPYGQQFDTSLCNTVEAGIGSTTAVHTYTHGVSFFGLFDMAGNVEEWTADYYRPYPGGVLISDDLHTTLGAYRVLRGGSFARGGDLARCARRHGPFPAPEYRYTGFRAAVPEGKRRPDSANIGGSHEWCIEI